MKRMVWMGLLTTLLILGAGQVWSQEQETTPEVKPGDTAAKESEPTTGHKELKTAGVPYFYTGPDTGLALGGSILSRDLGGKVGRDIQFSADMTQSQYQSYSLEWSEPDFIKPGPRFMINLDYENKPARRFYGFGNDTEPNDICNYNWLTYKITPKFIYPNGVAKWRVRLQYEYKYVKPSDGTLDDPNDPRYSRPISEQYPKVFRGRQFQAGATAGPGIYLVNETTKDRFDIGGGREDKIFPVGGGFREFFLSYHGPATGSDYEYYYASGDLRQYFGFFNNNTALVVRGKAVVTQGNVPIWNLPSFGGGSDLRAFYDGRFRGKASTQYNFELRQGILPKWKWDLFGGFITIKYPFLFGFFEAGRVYDSYTQIGNNILKDYHPSYGGGLRFIITPTLVIRVEYVYSPEFAFTLDPTSRSLILNSDEPF